MSLNSTNTSSYPELLLKKIKTILLLAVFAVGSLNVFAQNTSLISDCGDFVSGPSAWPHVLVATTVADGAVSQGSQTFTMNVTSLPAGGANFRVFKTTANGGNFFGNAIALTLGTNTITVAAVTFDRAVKFQFSAGDVEFDALSLNGADSDCIVPLPPPPTSLISDCGDFTSGPSAWPYVLIATTVADGAASQAAQTFTMNVTSLPAGGANVRVYKTTANGNDFFATPVALTLGSNSITVAAVSFDRAVKFQFSAGDVEFDALSLNGVDSDCALAVPPPTSLISDCGDFTSGPSAWPFVLTATTAADGAASQAAQTFTMNVTSLPAGGANYRVYKTTANGNDFFGPAQAMTLGSNGITVGAVSFDRAVKFQFSSGDVEFDALSLNGVDSDCALAVTSIPGCTDSTAFNYDPSATSDDGSCIAVALGCTDATAFNYDPSANTDDGSCIAVVLGCTDATALNYDASANTDDGSCTFCTDNLVDMVMNDSWGDGWNGATYTVTDGTTTATGGLTTGSTSTDALCLPDGCYDVTVGGGSYDSEITFDFGSLVGATAGTYQVAVGAGVCAVFGCTDSTATNYDASANTDDGSCSYDILGCTDVNASNYDASATVDDGSCIFPCLDNTVSITCDGGSFQSEVTWNLYDSNGGVVATGGAPFAGDFCLPDDCYQIEMLDSWGDGWNGNTLTIDGAVFGTSFTSGTVANDQVAIGATGFCAVFGCTDPLATNYDASANTDDGSCQYSCTAAPYSENFDAGLGTWSQDATDGFDWSIGSSTPSSFTGPQAGDVTGGDFLYTESSGNYGNTAGLTSECFDISALLTHGTCMAYVWWYCYGYKRLR